MERIWFKRKFHFDIPPEVFPNIVERLRGTPARVEELVGSLDRKVLANRRENQWSIQEHIGHLWDLEPLGMSRLEDFVSGKEVLTAADLENKKTHEGNHNDREIGELLRSFREARKEFVKKLESFEVDMVERSALHPRLKTNMRVVDLAFFHAEHDDHHLASITQLTRRFTTNIG